MGIKDKASKIDFGALPGVLPGPTSDPSAAARPKTAPGLMMAQAVDQRSGLLQENESLKAKVEELGEATVRLAELRDELMEWDGAKATRLIDPKLIARSKWANRDPRHFQTPEFEALQNEIASSGGNVQPVKIRPLGATGNGEGPQYELVYGHRRYEACRRLGLPVLAFVDNLNDQALFVEMDRENRSRKDLSAWEQGVMYRRALEEGLFTSNRKLADSTGVDLAQVGKALALARLPQDVVDAFASPLDLQFRWAKPLADAAEADAAGLAQRAQKARALGPDRGAKQVYELLLGGAAGVGDSVAPLAVEMDGKTIATVAIDAKGRVTVSFAAAVVEPARLMALRDAVEAFVKSQPKGRR